MDWKSTEMLTGASAFMLCFVLVIGLKLRWFRARMRFDTNNISNGSSSVAATSAPTFSIAGVYRPIGNSSALDSQVQPFYTKTEQRPLHHKSMPNLTGNLNQLPTESLVIVDTSTKTRSIQEQELPVSSKTETLPSNAEAFNSVAPNFKQMKPKENGDIYSSTPDMLAANQFQVESKRKKKKKIQNAKTTKLESPEPEEQESGPDNFIFLNSNGKPISMVENKSPEAVSHKTKTKSKAKAPPPPLTNSKFHEYEEFDT